MTNTANQTQTGKQDISHYLRTSIQPTEENRLIYDDFSPNADDDDYKLWASIKAEGIREPLHISADGFLLSGHRRLAAAGYLGLETVPVIVSNVVYADLSGDERVALLAVYNQQRNKSHAERLREALMGINPDEAYSQLQEHRADRLRIEIDDNVVMGSVKVRSRITTMQFLAAAQAAIDSERDYWPLTVRRIHYLLLNDPPLRHDLKSNSVYQNDLASYKALTNLLLRARLFGLIHHEAVEDETRPISILASYQEPADFIKNEVEGFLWGYRRDLLRGQANHLEILCEKNAIRKHVELVAHEYGIPCTTGRGYSSLTPRYKMVRRFRASGKERLVLLILSDFDPDGEEIAASFPRSLRDDFGVKSIQVSKVALTGDDVVKYSLPGDMEAKESSPNYQKFVKKHGTHVAELDSCPVKILQEKLRTAIESCLDMPLFHAERSTERGDAAYLAAQKKLVLQSMKLAA